MKFSAEIIFRLGDGLTKQLVVENKSEKTKKESVGNFYVDNTNHLTDQSIIVNVIKFIQTRDVRDIFLTMLSLNF